ncbi:MAG: hypothetical protein Q8K04_11110 [Lutibacter sp.]|nr:hypothetical protein [Lutibacter sp.]MDP3945133.1 hypothetical protein [Lutibacter sp.]
MKHLKKLSVVLMLTALFSVTFTSCIDNEVSPLVEAIYEAQADLIAAQAGVQNAEAALLLAQANAENAQATYTASLTAQVNAETAGIIAFNAYEAAQRTQWLLELVAETNVAVAAAQHDLQIAQAQFNIDMAALTAQMQAAGANLAVGYAYDYMYAMQVVNSLKGEKLTKQGQLALAELYLKAGTPETTWALYLAGLNTKLSTEQAKVTAAQAAIVTLNTAKANPTAIETQLAGLKTQKATLEARKVQLVGLIALAEQNRLTAQKAVDDAVAFMADPAGPYATTKASLATWKANYTADSLAIKTQTANVTLHTNAINSYDATYTALKGDVNTALGVIGWKPMTTDALVIANPYVGVATSPASGRLKDIADVTAAIGSYGTAPVYVYGGMSNDVPRTGAAALTAYGKLWNADLALLKFEADFAELTASYNAAAAELAVQQAAFDGSTYTADLATANTNYNTALTARNNAQTAYNTAKTAFELAPAGSVVTDGPGLASDVDAWFNTIQFDLGNTGLEGLGATTYMQVTSWRETTIGSGLYVPATFAATKYSTATLATKVTALIADAAYSIDDNTDIYIWNDLAGTMPFDDYNQATTSANYSADASAISSTVPAMTQLALPTAAVFVEVESDDISIPTLWTFNVATNKLGTNSFASRSYTSDGLPKSGSNTWTAVLTFTDTDAGYLSTWNGSGVMGAPDTLTAQAALWNMGLELAKKQYAFDTGSDALNDAKDDFAYQKELFDLGLTTRANLQGAVDAAKVVLGKVTTSTPASGLLGDLELLNAKLGLTTPIDYSFLSRLLSADKLTTSTTGAFYTVGTVKTLTDYAMLFNARKDFNALVSVSKAAHQTMLAAAQAALTTATREAAEDLIFIAKYTADLAALQAQYDALIVTPLYAALNVTLVNATQAKAALVAEDAAATISISSLTTLIAALQTTVPNYTQLIADQNLIITNANAEILATQIAISKGNVDLAALQANVQNLKDQIAVLTIRIANAQAIADKFKALMTAALAS